MDILSLVLYGDQDLCKVHSWLTEEPEDGIFEYVHVGTNGRRVNVQSSKESFVSAVLHYWNVGVYSSTSYVFGCAEKYFTDAQTRPISKDKGECLEQIGDMKKYKLLCNMLGNSGSGFHDHCIQCQQQRQVGCTHEECVRVTVVDTEYIPQSWQQQQRFARVLGLLVGKGKISYTVFLDWLQCMSKMTVSSNGGIYIKEVGCNVLDLWHTGLPSSSQILSKDHTVPPVSMTGIPSLLYIAALTMYECLHMVQTPRVPMICIYTLAMYQPSIWKTQVCALLLVHIQPTQTQLEDSVVQAQLLKVCKSFVFSVYYPEQMEEGREQGEITTTLPQLHHQSHNTQFQFTQPTNTYHSSTISSPFASPQASQLHSPALTPKPSVSPFITNTPNSTVRQKAPLITNFSHQFPNTLQQPYANPFLPQILQSTRTAVNTVVSPIDATFEESFLAAMAVYMSETRVADESLVNVSDSLNSEHSNAGSNYAIGSYLHELSTVETSLKRLRGVDSKRGLDLMSLSPVPESATNPQLGSVDELFAILETFVNVPRSLEEVFTHKHTDTGRSIQKQLPKVEAGQKWWFDSLLDQLVLHTKDTPLYTRANTPFHLTHPRLVTEICLEVSGQSTPVIEMHLYLMEHTNSQFFCMSNTITPQVSSMLEILLALLQSAVGPALERIILLRIEGILTRDFGVSQLLPFIPLLAYISSTKADVAAKYNTLIDQLIWNGNIHSHFTWIYCYLYSCKVQGVSTTLTSLVRLQKLMYLNVKVASFLCNGVPETRHTDTEANMSMSTQPFSPSKQMQPIELSSFDFDVEQNVTRKLPLPSSSSFSPLIDMSHPQAPSDQSPLIGALNILDHVALDVNIDSSSGDPQHFTPNLNNSMNLSDSMSHGNPREEDQMSYIRSSKPVTSYQTLRSTQILRSDTNLAITSIHEAEGVSQMLCMHGHTVVPSNAGKIMKEPPICIVSGIMSLFTPVAATYYIIQDLLGSVTCPSTAQEPERSILDETLEELLFTISEVKVDTMHAQLLDILTTATVYTSIGQQCSTTSTESICIAPIITKQQSQRKIVKSMDKQLFRASPRVIVPQVQSQEIETSPMEQHTIAVNAAPHFGYTMPAPIEGTLVKIKALTTLNPSLAASLGGLTELHAGVDCDMFAALFEQDQVQDLSEQFERNAGEVQACLSTLISDEMTMQGRKPLLDFFVTLIQYGKTLGQTCLQNCLTLLSIPVTKAMQMYVQAATKHIGNAVWELSMASQLTQRYYALQPLQETLETLQVQHNTSTMLAKLHEREASVKSLFAKRAYNSYSKVLAFDAVPIELALAPRETDYTQQQPVIIPLQFSPCSIFTASVHRNRNGFTDVRCSLFETLYSVMGCTLTEYIPGHTAYTLKEPQELLRVALHFYDQQAKKCTLKSIFQTQKFKTVWRQYERVFYIHTDQRKQLQTCLKPTGKCILSLLATVEQCPAPLYFKETPSTYTLINMFENVVKSSGVRMETHAETLWMQEKCNLDTLLQFSLKAPTSGLVSTLVTTQTPQISKVCLFYVSDVHKAVWSNLDISALWSFYIYAYALQRVLQMQSKKCDEYMHSIVFLVQPLQTVHPGNDPVYRAFQRRIVVSLLQVFPSVCME